jgi:hypothetical protein
MKTPEWTAYAISMACGSGRCSPKPRRQSVACGPAVRLTSSLCPTLVRKLEEKRTRRRRSQQCQGVCPTLAMRFRASACRRPSAAGLVSAWGGRANPRGGSSCAAGRRGAISLSTGGFGVRRPDIAGP